MAVRRAGDKTMYDALAPACDALDAAIADGLGLDEALDRAAEAAAGGPRRDDSHAGPQGSRFVPRRAQRGTSGSGGDVHRHAGGDGTGSGRRRFAMTGLVVVSHSRALADSAVALASEMLHGSQVRIAVAAGLDATTFGTDATAIVEAIHAADDGEGVVVLMDLGSAVLSAEMALDMIDPAVRERVVLCPAPLVEGLVVAAVSAAGGATPAEVAAEAIGSLAAKQFHVNPPDLSSVASDGALEGGLDEGISPDAETFASVVVKIANPHGLHARPAARLVQEARLFDARIELRNLDTGAGPVPATSLSKVATLGALSGHRVELTATGSQAREALDHVVALANRRFDEQESVIPSSSESSAGDRAPGTPMPASPGIAIGPALSMRAADIEVPDESPQDHETEWRRVRGAIAEVRREIQRIRAKAARESGESEARIFDAHLMLIDDTDLLDAVRSGIGSGAAATRAWADAIADVEAEFDNVSDDYLRSRALDVHAVGQQVARSLAGAPPPRIDGEGILIADDLVPAQVADLDISRVTGLVLAEGSPTAHSAILARAKGDSRRRVGRIRDPLRVRRGHCGRRRRRRHRWKSSSTLMTRCLSASRTPCRGSSRSGEGERPARGGAVGRAATPRWCRGARRSQPRRGGRGDAPAGDGLGRRPRRPGAHRVPLPGSGRSAPDCGREEKAYRAPWPRRWVVGG